MNRQEYIPFILVLLFTSGASAQSRLSRLANKANSLLRCIYQKVDYDTTYISRSDGKMGLKMWGNVSGMNLDSRGNDMKAGLKTDEKATLSMEVDYYDLALELALNPASLSGRNKDYEMNLNLYGRRYSLDASYQMAETMRGDVTVRGQTGYMEKGWMTTNMLNVAAHYTFNYRHFSYDAPFYQFYRQKRSAGSWLAGISYQGGAVKTSKEMLDTLSNIRFYAGHFAIGGGYAYNWVPSQRWLLHVSAIPNIVVWTGDNVTIDGERQYTRTRFPTMLINGRIAAVYYFTPRSFVGFNAVASTLLKRNSGTQIKQRKWLARVYYGIRL